ncbi:hypothetical protein MMC13_004222 [Lambiella insularis]|nr:hypothetical protein [Lambiella insularis]
MEDQDMPSSPRKKLKMDTEPSGLVSTLQSTKTEDPVPQSGDYLPVRQPIDFRKMQLHKEEDVGITELNPRYTDFLVNEILPTGEVVHLDSLKLLKKGKKENSTQTEARSLRVLDAEISSIPAVPEALESSDTAKLETVPENATAEKVDEEKPKTEVKDEVLASETATVESVKAEEPSLNVANQDDAAIKEAPAPETTTVDSSKAEEPSPNIANKDDAAIKESTAIDGQKDLPTVGSLSPADGATMGSFFEEEIVSQVLALFNRILNSPHRKPKDYGTVKSSPITDRDVRTKIHQELRRIFVSRLESYTDEHGAMFISAAPEKSNNSWVTKPNGGRNPSGRNSRGGRSGGTGKLGWKDLGGEYLHFSLYKENKDTMEVVSFLSRQLQVKPQSFQFAGTKDRRAVTVQRVSVYRVYADRMIAVGRSLRGAKIGNFEYQPKGLELGELTGNEFVITLRDCDFPSLQTATVEDRLAAASATVTSAAKLLSEKGFLNYYGLQRFGTFSTRTDTIGKLMIQGDFKGAVDAILHFTTASLAAAQYPVSDNDTISSDDKARAWSLNSFKVTGKAYPALDDLPRKFSAESNLIRYLGTADHSNDHLGALQTIPRNLRLMYVHAYQSLVWNMAASHRWKHGGTQVVVGDLVLVNEKRDKLPLAPEPEQVDADGEVVVQPAAEDSATSAENRFIRARALTAEDIASENYSIYDVVLPTPGFDVLYPENAVKTFYETFMASEEGGKLDPHDMRRPWKDISLSGSYRKLLAKPSKEIEVDVRAYVDNDQQFVDTDLDRLYQRKGEQSGGEQQSGPRHGQGETVNGVKKEAVDEKNQAADPPIKSEVAEGHKDVEADAATVKVEPTSEPEPVEPVEQKAQKIAVILKMQLGASQYATMALRELMKLGVQTYKPDFGGGR